MVFVLMSFSIAFAPRIGVINHPITKWNTDCFQLTEFSHGSCAYSGSIAAIGKRLLSAKSGHSERLISLVLCTMVIEIFCKKFSSANGVGNPECTADAGGTKKLVKELLGCWSTSRYRYTQRLYFYFVKGQIVAADVKYSLIVVGIEHWPNIRSITCYYEGCAGIKEDPFLIPLPPNILCQKKSQSCPPWALQFYLPSSI